MPSRPTAPPARRPRAALLIAALTTPALLPALSPAQSITWTGGGTAPNWDNFTVSQSTAQFRNWSSLGLPSPANTVVFGSGFSSGTTVNTVGSRTVNALSIDTSTPFTLAGALTLNSGDITRSAASSNTQTISASLALAAGADWTINGAGALAVTGPVTGNFGLHKLGSATLTLGGTSANTYTGQTTVSAGTLALAKNPNTHAISGSDLVLNPGGTARLDASHQIVDSANLVMKGGALDLNNNAEVAASLIGTEGSIAFGTAGTAALSVIQQQDATLDLTFSGVGILRKNGLANLTLTHTASPNTLGSLQSGGGTLNASGGAYTLRDFVPLAAEVGGTVAITSGANVSAVPGTEFAFADSGGTLLVSGSNTTLHLPSQTIAGNTGNGAVVIDAASVTGGNFLGAARQSGSSGTVSIRNGARLATGILHAGAHPGSSGTVTVTGPATAVTLSAALVIGGVNNGLFGGAGAVTVDNGATLSTSEIAFLSSSTALTIDRATVTTTFISQNAPASIRITDPSPSASALTLTVPTATQAGFAGAILNGPAGAGSLTKAGPGNFTLSGENSAFTGPVNIDAGTLSTPAISSPGLPSPLGAGSAIRLGSAFATGTLRFTGDLANAFRTVTLAGNGGAIDTLGDLTLNSVAGPANFSKSGNGALTLLNLNANLVNLADGAIRTASLTANTVILSQGTTLELFAGPSSVSSMLTVNAFSTATVNAGNLAASRLAGNGAVALSDPTSNNTPALTLAGDSSSWTFAGNITDRLPGSPGSVAKAGTGTVALLGLNTYTGRTNVNAGTLVLNNSLLGTGAPVTLSTGATLEAQGVLTRRIAGAGTVNATGALLLGDPSDAFSFNGTLNVGSNPVTLLTNASATLGPSTTLGNAGQLAASVNILIPSTGALSSTAPLSTVASNLVNAGTVTGPTFGTGIVFRGDVSGPGTFAGNLRFDANFNPAGRVNLTQFQINTGGAATLNTPSPVSALVTSNNGQLRVLSGSPNLGLLNGSGSTTVSGGALTLNAISQSSLTVAAGSVAIAPTVQPNTTSRLSSLTLHPAATFDLARTHLLLDYTGPANSPLQQIRQYLASAYTPGGTWTGPGLTSSAARALATHQTPGAATALGYSESSLYMLRTGATAFNTIPLDGSEIIVTYTLAGDATLDGLLTDADLDLLIANYGSTSATWTTADFTYDGAVNDRDLDLLTAALAHTHPAIQVTPASLARLAALPTSPIPEPSLALTAPAAACLLATRRKTRRPPLSPLHASLVAPRPNPPQSQISHLTKPTRARVTGPSLKPLL